MKHIFNLFVAIVLVMAMASGGFANGLSLNSIGTRALGMGGAMVGLADDATAIYWNPSGISNVQGAFVGVYVTPITPAAKYAWSYPTFGIDIDTEADNKTYVAPNLFATFQSGDWTFGLGVYVPAGLGVQWNGEKLAALSGGDAYEWMAEVAAIDFSPTVSYKVTDALSLGLAVNVYYAMFDLKRPVEVAAQTYAQYSEESTGTAFGVTLGAQYKINEMITLGATWRSEANVKMNGTAKNPAFAQMGAAGESEFDRDVAWPMWIAGGIAVRPTECWVITADAQYSQWSKTQDVLTAEFKDPQWQASMEASGGNEFELHWKDATQIRFGTEWLATDALAVRAGYYFDPAPAPDETLNILFPSSTNNTVALGAGYRAGQWDFQLGAEYLIGKERVISDELNNPANPFSGFVNEMPGTHQMDIFAVSIGVGYAF
jgi:long-chain fatty acid transport protein